jgi:PD-(D/E)XK nuclease superfamily
VLPSGSKIALAFECQHPWTSPTPWPKDDDPLRFAFGNAVHFYAESYASYTDSVQPDAIAAKYNLNATDRRRFYDVACHIRVRLLNMMTDGWAIVPEVAVAYHALNGTARFIRRASHRDYSDVRRGEMAATLDIVALKPGRVRLQDWKSGRFQWRDGASWQMKFGALALARALGATEVETELNYIDEDGIRDDAHALDTFDLDEAAHELRALWPKLTSGPTPPIMGSHCVEMWCPLAGRCAATRAALAEVRSSSAVRIATPEDAARVWELLPAAEAAVKAAKAQIKEMAARSPIPLRNGKRLVVAEQSRETVSLDAHTAAMVPREALEHSTSAAAIKRALDKPAAAQLLAELRAAGAMRESTYTIVREQNDNTEKESA